MVFAIMVPVVSTVFCLFGLSISCYRNVRNCVLSIRHRIQHRIQQSQQRVNAPATSTDVNVSSSRQSLPLSILLSNQSTTTGMFQIEDPPPSYEMIDAYPSPLDQRTTQQAPPTQMSEQHVPNTSISLNIEEAPPPSYEVVDPHPSAHSNPKAHQHHPANQQPNSEDSPDTGTSQEVPPPSYERCDPYPQTSSSSAATPAVTSDPSQTQHPQYPP